MKLNFLGKDSGFGDNNNAAYIEVDNTLFLIDCGFSVFSIVKKQFDFSKYNEIKIIVTHLHNDHAGSLSQVILYIWTVYHKKVTVISSCENIGEYLVITGTMKEAYTIKNFDENVEFIKTSHTPELDAYGFLLKLGNEKILYTGDTCIIEPFEKYFDDISELYIDVSTKGGVHLKIEEVLPKLFELKDKGIEIILMHLDDKEAIKEITRNKFIV